MKAIIETVPPQEFAPIIADEIITVINESIENKGWASLVLSGGRTPSIVYRTLSLPPRVNEVNWNKVKIFWGDERWVPQDSEHSNYNMAQQTLIKNLPNSLSPKIFPINTSLGDIEKAAIEYEDLIRKELNLKESELPSFDLVLLGVGEDGHIASLFPKRPEININDKLVVPVQLNKEGDFDRITLTMPAMKNAKEILVMIRGESKADIAYKLLQEGSKGKTKEEYPAVALNECQGSVVFYIDTLAAKKLENI